MTEDAQEHLDRKTEIAAAFDELWSDLDERETFPTKRPLLAHYTTISAMERIMCTNEIWFSNPLLMNDVEELRFGIQQGTRAFHESEDLRTACRTSSRWDILASAFEQCYAEFEGQHAFDTYVLCFSEHDAGNFDGVLSMWRGYGGNGDGAAIVIDTSKINVNEESPLIISRVHYASAESRLAWIDTKLRQFANILTDLSLADDELPIAAYAIFDRLRVFSLFTKHYGFHEEREWRIVYMSYRDRERRFSHMLHYSTGERGIEPKLKFRVEPIPGLTDEDLSLDKLMHSIILGPTVSNPMAVKSVCRMLELTGHGELLDRLKVSTTPFRPFRF